MKRAIKIAIRASSIALVGSLVFFGSILSKSNTKDQDQKKPADKKDGLFSAFDVPSALADTPGLITDPLVCSGDSTSGSGTGSGNGSGSSGNGDGSGSSSGDGGGD